MPWLLHSIVCSNVRADIFIIPFYLFALSFMTEMLGYVSKDEGLAHFQRETKGVTQAELNVSLSNHRARARKHVKDRRTELGKKNFCAAMHRYYNVRCFFIVFVQT